MHKLKGKMKNSKKIPEAIGPYSQFVKFDKFVFTAAQIAINPKTNQLVEGSIEEQTKQVLENLKNVLEAAGSSMDKAIKVNVFLKDMNDFGKMNGIYAEYFKNKPARSTVQAAKLPRDALILVDVVAGLK